MTSSHSCKAYPSDTNYNDCDKTPNMPDISGIILTFFSIPIDKISNVNDKMYDFFHQSESKHAHNGKKTAIPVFVLFGTNVHIKKNHELFLHKCIFVGSDCQSALVALTEGPLWDYQHSCTKIAWSTTYQSYLHVANTYDCNFHIQYIPGHVGIQPNEVIDQLTKTYAASFTTEQQSILDTDLTALKSTLHQTLIKHWISSIPLLSARYHLCGLQCPHLKHQRPLPCALQCLYSWWHVGKVESAGVYPHRLDWIQLPRCHFCG